MGWKLGALAGAAAEALAKLELGLNSTAFGFNLNSAAFGLSLDLISSLEPAPVEADWSPLD